MPSPSGLVDLRSDTVTTPTPEMRRAMADAEVGDDAYGEDPTVNRLQSLAAALLGKEAALYVPSGTMANQLALRVLGRRGTEVLCGERAHVFRYEAAAAAGNAGVQLRPIPDPDGVFGPEPVETAAADRHHHLPPISAVTIENTHMPASGRPWRVAEVDAVAGAARRHGLALHCDGARIWNAAIALGVAPAELTATTDTVMFCLSKGLGAPVGSLLCGPAATIAAAREERARLGGGMRQAGVIAAAGIVALETMVERLADDHARARRIAEVLADRFPGSIDPAAVETNIVCAPLELLPDKIVERLAERGVQSGTIDARTRALRDAQGRRRRGPRRGVVVALDEIAARGALTMARVLLTGCSTGFGRAAAVELTKRGHDVVATARRPESIADLDVAQTLTLDVDDDVSVAAAVAAAGEVDVAREQRRSRGGRSRRADPDGGRTADLRDELLRRVADDPGRRAVDARRAAAGRSSTSRPSPDASRLRSTGSTARRSSRWRASPRRCTTRSVTSGSGCASSSPASSRPLSATPRCASVSTARRTTSSTARGRSRARSYPAGAEPPPPEAVAVAIADAIECEEPKLRWPVGADADLVLPIRAAMDDEAFEQTMRSVLELEW